MKNLLRFAFFVILSILFGNVNNYLFAQTLPIKVAVYNDSGVGSGDAAKFEACLTDTTKYRCTEVLGADIRNGILNNFDIILFPGGSGSGESASLGSEGLDSVRSFIYRGGGYYGTCAGSYLASADYTWSLHIINTKVIDKAHWNRGNGTVIVDFSEEGKEFYGLSQDSVHVEYRQGALMAPNNVDTLPGYIKLGTFATEIALNGAPTGVMVGTTAYAQTCFGKGRVIVLSPHPEITDSLHYMVQRNVDWVGDKSNFSKFASPQAKTQWEAESSQAIQWICGNGTDTMVIKYSSDGGSNWSTVSSASVGSYNWTVPNTPSTNCLLSITSKNRAGVGDTVAFVIVAGLPTITSIASGSWNSTSTWSSGTVPDSLHNVLISAGHTVTVNSAAYCKNISFGDESARLGLNANIYIFGNFYRFNTTANPFYSTSNLWKAGAKMVFTGTAAEQTVTNLGTTSSSPYPLRFNEVIIDKDEGKFTTGTGANLKIGIGTSLEVMSGTFELGSTDDLEGRNAAGTATTPTIVVDSGAVFNMVGSSSYIRRGNFTGEESEKIGKMTIYGTVYLVCGTTSNVSFTNIDIEDGGLLYIPTGRGWSANTFNPGTVTIKNGGTYRNSLTTNIWYTNPTTPTTLVIQDGGIFLTYSGSTPFPPVITNNGTVKYGASTFDQTIKDMDYSRLELSYTGGFKKNWTLAASRVISDTLEINNSAILALTAASSQTLTINNALSLRTGSVDNSNANVTLKLADGATVTRLSGTLTNTPVFAGTANVIYAGSSAISTGNELPAASSVLNNLSFSNSGTVKLTASAVVNGTLTLNGIVNLNGNTLTLGNSASTKGTLVYSSGHLTGNGTFTRWLDNSAITANSDAGRFPMGTTTADASVFLSGTPTAGGTVSAQYASATGTTEFSPVLTETGGLSINKRHNMGWTLGTGNGLSGDAFTLSLSAAAISAQSADFISLPSNLDIVLANSLAPGTFSNGSGTVDAAFASRTNIAAADLNNSFYIGSDPVNALPVELNSFSAVASGRNINLLWATATEVNSSSFNVERKKSTEDAWSVIGTIKAGGNTSAPKSYSYVEKNLAGGRYSYRLKMVDIDGSYTYSQTVDADISIPKQFELSQNYPNPFNPTTRITYALPSDAQVTLELYAITGQKVATLVNKTAAAGYYDYSVNMNSYGLASGVYIYKFSARELTSGKNITLIKKMMCLK
jgi:hypothetical protein